MASEALLALLAHLRDAHYRFVTPTPTTHRLVLARPDKRKANDLRDVFGWNLPFAPSLLPAALHSQLDAAGLLASEGALLRSRVRVASIEDALFVHSAFPTDDPDSVFFGPDSYRFVAFLRAELGHAGGVRRLVDIGSGSGVGAIMAAERLSGAAITMLDINPAALRFAAANARHAGVAAELIEGGSLDAIQGSIDLVIANPPYLIDPQLRAYRHGGDLHGARLALDWTLTAVTRLEPGGRMLLYTGSAIVDGRDLLRETLERELPALGGTLTYRELDPDVFGEDLDQPAYADVERIAVVGATMVKSA